MASRGHQAVVKAQQDYIRCCELLVKEEEDEEDTAAAVSAAAEAAAALLLAGNEALQVAGEVAGADSAQGAAAGGSPTHFDEWLRCCEICCQSAFTARCGARIGANLGQRFPNLCAQWLTGLKHLASAAVLASDPVLQQGKVSPVVLVPGFDSLWPELGGIGGLSASRWRTRLAAVDLAVVLLVNNGAVLAESKAAPATIGLGYLSESRPAHVELLEKLVFRVANAASEVPEVKLSAINGAGAIIISQFQQLPGELYGELVGGLLATCMDPIPEVQKTGCEAVMNALLLSTPGGRQDVATKLVDKFIKTSLLMPVATLEDKSSKGKRSDELSWIAAAVNAILDLLLLPGPPFLDWTKGHDKNVDRLPLLLVASAAAYEESEKLKNRASAAKFKNLIRSMGKPWYRVSLLAMLNAKFGVPSGASVANLYEETSVLNEDEAAYLRTVPKVTVLRALQMALSRPGAVGSVGVLSSACYDNLLPISSTRPKVTADMELVALWAIGEFLQIPPALTKTYHEENSAAVAEEFVHCAESLVHIASFILEGASAQESQVSITGTLVQILFLAFAALASGEGGNQVEVFWTSKDLRSEAMKAVHTLSDAVHLPSPNSQSNSGKETSGTGDVWGVEGLISTLLPDMLPKLKEIIKSSSSFGADDNIYITSQDGDIGSSIVAAHQLAWCVKQVRPPHLGIHWHVVMPCALTALDHYSPVVKKQAMEIFLHLADNLNPSELRWYGDVTLDAVCRSLIGSGELWGLAIKMAVKLVTSIEGQNPRGVWYRRTFCDMLDELERHLDDQDRRIAWLETIKPQLEAMGLVLVAHFKRLLPLIYGWLHAPDDMSCISALGVLKTIIVRTWCRMPFHAIRTWKELSSVYREAEKRLLSAEIQAEVRENCRLLCLCGGPEFISWQTSGDDPLLRPLVLYVEQAIGSGQQSSNEC